MTRTDERGCRVSGADPAALALYERALASFSSWRADAGALAAAAERASPHFVMAHVLQAYMRVCSRDPRQVQSARPIVARAVSMRATESERMHLAAISAVLGDHYELAKTRLAGLLVREPRDLLALQVAHSLDYATGTIAGMVDRVEAVLPAWSSDMPGYHAVLAMHAFALEENGELELAETRAHAALALNPNDARAHHVMAHVFEAGDRDAAGIAWMTEHAARWQPDTTVATHGWWHIALFHLARGEAARALALYDARVRREPSGALSDLIDATSLLWRIRLHGLDAGARWAELAEAWDGYVDDAYCSFSDLHAMLAFVGARDGGRARRLELALAREQSRPTRHGATTRRLGLPACRALMAYGRGDDALAVTLLASLPTLAHRLGGSHAQRDVLHLTLLNAIERMRRPVRRPRAAPIGAGEGA
jgi:tetratricopeptide (TPR) repeat protein